MKKLILLLVLSTLIFGIESTRETQKNRGIFSMIQKDSNSNQSTIFNFGILKEDTNRNWTIMVYMDGDNDLESFAIKDLNEMEASIGSGVDVIVLVDRAKGYDNSNGDWSNSRVYKITRDNNTKVINSQLIQELGELNMGSTDVLQGFLQESITKFPAKHYALIMWNHGGGWSSHAIDFEAPNIKGMTHLTLPKLSTALKKALNNTKIGRLDIIGFDMCQMGQLESAVQLSGLANYMIASEANEPGDGWPYKSILPEFSTNNSPKDIAKAIVNHYSNFYNNVNNPLYTQSAIDLNKVEPFLLRLNTLVETIDINNFWADLSRAIFYSESYNARYIELNKGKSAIASMDLLDMFKRLNINSNLNNKEFSALKYAFNNLVIASATGDAYLMSNGISIYAPISYKSFNPKYNNLSITKSSLWSNFLTNIYNKQKNQTSPKITNLKLVNNNGSNLVPVNVATNLSTQGVSYTLDGTNILWVNGILGITPNNSNDIYLLKTTKVLDPFWEKKRRKSSANNLPLLIPKYKNGKSDIFLVYSGLYYELFNGNKSVIATINIPVTDIYYTMRAIYKEPNLGEYKAFVKFDPFTLQVASVTLLLQQKDGSVVQRNIKPSPNSTFIPIVEMFKANGDYTYKYGDPINWNNGLKLITKLNHYNKAAYILQATAIGGESTIEGKIFNTQPNSYLESLIKQNSNYNANNLVGKWTYIDADKFMKNAKIVPTGETREFSYYKNNNDELKAIYKDKNGKTNYFLVNASKDAIPFIRYTKTDTNFRMLKPFKDEDLYVYLTTVSNIGNIKVMMQFDTLSMKLSIAIKDNAQNTQTNTNNYQNTQNQTPQAQSNQTNSLNGIWISNNSSTIKIQGNRYVYSENGQIVDSGIFALNKGILSTKSQYTGVITNYYYSLNGNILLLKDAYGNIYKYFRNQ